MDHKAEFKLLVMEQLGKDIADNIEWSVPRLLCIAGDFTRYDEHAVQQINRNIELIRYRKYGSDLLLLELVNSVTATVSESVKTKNATSTSSQYKTITETMTSMSSDLADLYESVNAFILSLGDDVQIKTLKYYQAYKRLKNFTCLELRVLEGKVLLYVKVDPSSVTIEEGFTRDVRKIGHYGTGDLEISVRNDEDFDKAKPLILRSYENS